MIAESPRDVATIRECGRRLALITKELAGAIRPGIPTIEFDRMAERLITAQDGYAVFKGYRSRKDEPPFPASLCVSINDEVVHGIPRSGRIISEGDIVGLDIGMRWPASDGLITDMAVTVAVGRVSKIAARLLDVTSGALESGIAMLKPGIRLGDLGHTIQRAIESEKFSVVRDLVGHGVGRRLHEEPYVPNYGIPGKGETVREGMVLAIEPMATIGGPSVSLRSDGWTWSTDDGSLAAHFEHTVLVTTDGAEILTRF